MAINVSTVAKGVMGNVRYAVVSCSVDAAATMVPAQGMGFLFAATVGPVSMPTSTNRGMNVKINAGETGTSIAGAVGLSGFVSGDSFYLTLYGRS